RRGEHLADREVGELDFPADAPERRLESRARLPPGQRGALRGAPLPGAPAPAPGAARTPAAPAQEGTARLPDAGRGHCGGDPAPARLAALRPGCCRTRHWGGPLFAPAASDLRGDRPVPRHAARPCEALRLAGPSGVVS